MAIIPVNIASLSGNNIKRVPQTISSIEVHCKLAGMTVNASNHFTAIIPWFNKEYLYDGTSIKGTINDSIQEFITHK